MTMQNIGYTIHAGYGFVLGLPFSAYGEAGIMLLQNSLLLGLVYRYSGVNASRILSLAVANLAMIAAIITGECCVSAAPCSYSCYTAISVPWPIVGSSGRPLPDSWYLRQSKRNIAVEGGWCPHNM